MAYFARTVTINNRSQASRVAESLVYHEEKDNV